jgi:hypothetical protein
MKSTLLRPSLLLTMALTLAACGGTNTFPINVQLIKSSTDSTPVPLAYPGLVLTNGSDNLTVQQGTSSAVFGNRVDYGTVYNVAIPATGQPAHETCGVVNPTDTAGRQTAINVYVVCNIQTHALTATVTGLVVDPAVTGSGVLVLTNGTSGGTVTVSATAASATVTPPAFYTASFLVPYGNAYGVTVLTQPTNATCTVTNGTGTMKDDDITNIDPLVTTKTLAPTVKCVPK